MIGMARQHYRLMSLEFGLFRNGPMLPQLITRTKKQLMRIAEGSVATLESNAVGCDN